MTVYFDKVVKGWKSHFHYQKKEYKSKAFRTRKEAKAWEKSKRNEVSGKTLLLSKLVEKKLDDYILRNQKATATKVEQMYRCRIRPYLIDKDVESYTIRDINDMALRLKKKTPISETEFNVREQSNNSVNDVVKRLGSIFRWGIRNGYCTVNPCAQFQPMSYVPKEKQYWTEDEFHQVIESLGLEQYKLRARLELFFWTGMRKSEGRALQWKDFDPVAGTVTIDKHMIEDGGHQVIPGRKNGGVMVVPLAKETVETLIETQLKDMRFDGFNDEWYILGYKKPFTLSAFAEQLDALAKHTGVTRITPHGLRHSHVSWLYSNTDLTIQEVADRIGDTVETVLRTYAHLYKDNSFKIVSAINSKRKKS